MSLTKEPVGAALHIWFHVTHNSRYGMPWWCKPLRMTTYDYLWLLMTTCKRVKSVLNIKTYFWNSSRMIWKQSCAKGLGESSAHAQKLSFPSDVMYSKAEVWQWKKNIWQKSKQLRLKLTQGAWTGIWLRPKSEAATHLSTPAVFEHGQNVVASSYPPTKNLRFRGRLPRMTSGHASTQPLLQILQFRGLGRTNLVGAIWAVVWIYFISYGATLKSWKRQRREERSWERERTEIRLVVRLQPVSKTVQCM